MSFGIKPQMREAKCDYQLARDKVGIAEAAATRQGHEITTRGATYGTVVNRVRADFPEARLYVMRNEDEDLVWTWRISDAEAAVTIALAFG